VSAFAHLGRSVLGARYSAEREFALLACYMDEAGDKKTGFILVCGWLSTAALWEQFEIDWRLLLASYNVPYFHMKEFSQSTGPFKKWKDAEVTRKRFISEAIDITRHRLQQCFFCSVKYPVYEAMDRAHALHEILPSPYAVAGRACVAQLTFWQKNKAHEDVEFIFEDGGPDKRGLNQAMQAKHRLPDPIYKPSRDMKDGRKGLVQLQAADLMAYELRKYRVELVGGTGRPIRKSFYELLKAEILFMAVLNERNVTRLCQLEKPLARRP